MLVGISVSPLVLTISVVFFYNKRYRTLTLGLFLFFLWYKIYNLFANICYLLKFTLNRMKYSSCVKYPNNENAKLNR